MADKKKGKKKGAPGGLRYTITVSEVVRARSREEAVMIARERLEGRTGEILAEHIDRVAPIAFSQGTHKGYVNAQKIDPGDRHKWDGMESMVMERQRGERRTRERWL